MMSLVFVVCLEKLNHLFVGLIWKCVPAIEGILKIVIDDGFHMCMGVEVTAVYAHNQGTHCCWSYKCNDSTHHEAVSTVGRF